MRALTKGAASTIFYAFGMKRTLYHRPVISYVLHFQEHRMCTSFSKTLHTANNLHPVVSPKYYLHLCLSL